MNSRICRVASVAMVLFALVLLFVSCEDRGGASLIISSDTYVIEAGETIDVEQLREMFLADTESSAVTTASTAVATHDDTSADMTNVSADDEVADTVYWVKNGEVWHMKSTCASLSRSKNIISGTIEEAMLAGKNRVCKRCGN